MLINLRRPLVAAVLAVALLASACGEEEEGSGGGGPSTNPNRLPPGRYTQSGLSIPTLLDDPYLVASASWATAGAALPFLWSHDDLGVRALYPSLSLPTSELVVAVIDTGVDKDHEDISGRLWVNPGENADETYANGADDDGNGFADDFLGWDFVNDINNPADDSGHGSHVAGTIGAVGANARGIVGVAPWVRLMALKVCNQNGACSSSDIRAAIAYAVQHGAKIINLSLGALNTGSDALAFDQAIADATQAGVLVVTAAGNSAVDTSLMTPANATYSVAVAAHRNDGEICSFSNYGWKVDVSGPGCGVDGDFEVSGILSLNSRKCGGTGDRPCAILKSVGDHYALKSGTSMSAPHAAGMAAVAWTASPAATPLQIRQALIRTARRVEPGSVNIDFGMGRLSGTNLITEAQTAPGIRIVSPRYNAQATSHELTFRIEARSQPVSWELRYVASPGGTVNVDLSGGTVIASSAVDIDADSRVTLTRSWTPPASGSYLVILEAAAAGEKYHDVTLVRR